MSYTYQVTLNADNFSPVVIPVPYGGYYVAISDLTNNTNGHTGYQSTFQIVWNSNSYQTVDESEHVTGNYGEIITLFVENNIMYLTYAKLPTCYPTPNEGNFLQTFIVSFYDPTKKSYANFYALMPLDNENDISPGSCIAFPNVGVTLGTISAISPTQFKLYDIGDYSISFNMTFSSAGKLVLALNSNELPYTVVGTNNGSQLFGTFIITNSSVNSILTVQNPVANSNTLYPSAGVSAQLVIMKL